MAEIRKKGAFSSYWLFLLLALILAGAAVVLLPVYRNYQKKQQELRERQEELNAKRDESARLNTEVSDLQSSPGAVEKVARENFGLVKEGERVIRYPQVEKK